MAKQLNVNLSFTADTRQAKAQLNSLKNDLSSLGSLTSGFNSAKPITEELTEAANTAYKLKVALQQATDVDTGKLNLTLFNKSLKNQQLSLSQVRKDLTSLGADGQKAFLTLASAIQTADAPLVNLGGRLKELVNTFSNTIRWQAASSAIHIMQSELSQAYNYAKDLNSALNDIRIVSGESADSMAKFAEKANKAARALSQTTEAYAQASLIYFQQGLGSVEVEERTEATLKMVAVTGEAADDVSSYMTAVWNNFNKDGEESAEHYGDIMTKLGAATAASTEEIAEGLEKFASVADTIGLSFEYASSAVTTVVDRTRQSAEVVGTALKTIFSRIQGLQLGETQDDGTTLNKYSQGLLSVGINIKDVNGNLKDMDTILNEIGAKWDTLAQDQKVALAQTVAGVRQYNQFMSLFDNWDFMEQNLEWAYGADGTLDEQAEIYAESWEAASKRVQAAAEAIYSDLIDDDAFISILDGIEKLLVGVDGLIDSMGGLPGILALVGTAFTKVFNKQLVAGLQNATYAMTDFKAIAYNLGLKGAQKLNFAQDKEKKQLSSEILRNEAAKEMQAMGADLGQKGQGTAFKAFSSIGVVQEKIQKNQENMTLAEKQFSQLLMERVQLETQALFKDEEQLQIEQQQLQQAIDINVIKEKLTKKEQQAILDLNSEAEQYQKILKILIDIQSLEAVEGNNLNTGAVDKQIQEKKTQLKQIGYFDDEFINNAQSNELFQVLRTDYLDDNTKYANARNILLNSKNATARRKASEVDKFLADSGTSFENRTESITRLDKSTNAAAETIERFGKRTLKTSEYVPKLASGLSQLGFAYSSLGSIVNTVTHALDDNHLSFSEILSIITSASMTLPMAISGFKDFGASFAGIGKNLYNNDSLIDNAKQEIFMSRAWSKDPKWQKKEGDTGAVEGINDISAEELNSYTQKPLKAFITNVKTATAMNEGFSISTLKQAASTTIATNSTLKLTLAFGQYALVALAIIKTAKFLYEQWIKDAIALEKAKEATERATSAFEDAKSAYEDLKSTISDYNDQIEAISELTKGTTEWYEAIQKANESVLSLLEAYPELASMMSTDENGMLVLSEEAQDQVLNSQQAIYKNAQRNLYDKQIEQNTAENNDAITNFVRGVDTSTNERGIIKSLLQDYQSQGNSALNFNAEILADRFSTSVEDAQRLIDNGISELIVSLNANTDATDLLAEQRAASTLSQHMTGYDESYFKDSLAQYQAEKSSSGTLQIEASKAYADLSRKEIVELYAEAIGADTDDFDLHAIFDRDTVEYGDEELSYKDIKDFIKNEAADMLALELTQQFSKSVTSLYDELSDKLNEDTLGHNLATTLSKGLTEALSSNDPKTAMANFVNTLNDEEFAELENMDNNSSIQAFYEKNKDYFIQLGYKDAQAFQTAYNEALNSRNSEEANENSEITKQEQWKDSLEDLATSLDMDSDAVEGYTETLRELYPALKENDEATLEAVERHIAFSKGFDSLVDVLDDYEEALSDTNDTGVLTAEALAAVGDAMEQMMGVHVSNSYIKENLTDIKAMAEGDLSALEKLQLAAAKDYVVNGLIIPEEDKKEITSFIDSINGMNLEMSATATVEDQSFIDSMNTLIEAGKITAEEVNEALGAIGYSANVTYKEIDGPTTDYEQDTTIGSGVLSKFLSFHVKGTSTSKIQVPVLNGEVTRTSTPSSLSSSISSAQTKKSDSGNENEMERYHTVSNQLETLENQYEKIAAAKDKAYGADKLKYLDLEIEKQEEIIEKQKEYLAQAQANLKYDKSKMSAYGAKYDENGNITNYRTLFKKYGQDETFQKRLENYEESLHLVEEKEAAVADAIIEEKSLEYEKIISKFDYKIEQDEKHLEILEKMFDNLSDDVYKMAEAFQILMGVEGESSSRIETLSRDMEMYQTQVDELNQAWADGKLNESDYVDGLNDSLDALVDLVDTYEELIDTVKEYYGETLKAAQEELQNYTDQIDNAAKKLEHFRKVQELSGQGTDYETTLKLLDAQIKVVKNSFDVAQEWYETRAEDEATIRARLAAIDKETNPVEWEIENQKLKDAVEATQDAYDSMASYREEYLELAEEEYKTTIDSIAAYASSALAGDGFLNLDSLLDSMQNVKTRADEYLTKTNQLYETDKLRRQVLADIDKTSNKAAKQRLSNFTKEIDAAQQQTELSNLELEILQAKYKQLQAQIALEEAQNAKSTVRLSRDNEGNYGYIYTADKDNIADAQQALDDADNDLYNIRLKAFNEYSEKKIQAEKDLNDKIKEIWEDETLSYEEKEAEIQRITEEHYAIIDAYTDLATIAQQEDARIQADAWAAAYSQQSLDATEWKKTVETCMDEAEVASQHYHELIDPMVDTTKEKYDTLTDAIDATVQKSDELADEAVETVIPTLDEEIDKVDDLTSAYGKNLQGMQDIIKETKNYITSIQNIIANLKEQTKAQKALNAAKAEGTGDGGDDNSSVPDDSTKGDTEEDGNYSLHVYVAPVSGSYSLIHNQVYSSKTAVTDKVTEFKKQYPTSRYSTTKSSWSGSIYYLQFKKKSATSTSSDNSSNSTTVAKDIAAIENGKKTYSYTWNGTTYQGSTKAQVQKLLKKAYTSYYYDKYKKYPTSTQLATWVKSLSFDTGGYTGDWQDTSGKLAVLHKKELVLNAEDTKNFLAGINVVRDISKQIDLQAFYQSSNPYTGSIKPASANSTLQQEVMIKAEFPNATNHTEIEQAFDTLINKAAQYANRRD